MTMTMTNARAALASAIEASRTAQAKLTDAREAAEAARGHHNDVVGELAKLRSDDHERRAAALKASFRAGGKAKAAACRR